MVAWLDRAAGRPNPAAAARWVVRGTAALGETLYAQIARVPPGHALVVGDTADLQRVWHPRIAAAGEGEPAGVLERFEHLFEQAVARCASDDGTGLFLSGGIDSSLLAASLARLARERGEEPPLALSIRFPDALSNEEAAQRAIAKALGLRHVVASLRESLGGIDLIAAGIEASRRAWHPTSNPWNVAYEVMGSRSGCRAVLSGEGANDWLDVPWEWGADLLRRGDPLRVVRFFRAQGRYYDRPGREFWRAVTWTYVLRPHLRRWFHRAGSSSSPGSLAAFRLRRAEAQIPDWALPDGEVRTAFVSRDAEQPVPTGVDFQAGFRRRLLDSGFTPIAMEWYDLLSRRGPTEYLSPYYDVDLVEFLLALSPSALLYEGNVKGLAYASFARQAPGLVGQRPRPAWFNSVLGHALRAEAGTALRDLGGLPLLGGMGVVDTERATAFVHRVSQLPEMSYYQAWRLLATEAWFQTRFA
jgi:hypothetical protein